MKARDDFQRDPASSVNIVISRAGDIASRNEFETDTIRLSYGSLKEI